jgi:hypothetical protein
MDAIVTISTNKAAYILNIYNKTNINKGDMISCDMIVETLFLNLCDEYKKVLLNEIIDIFTSEQFGDFYKKNPHLDIEKGRRLIRELNNDYQTGKWKHQELEFDVLYEKIKRREAIIKTITDTEERNKANI